MPHIFSSIQYIFPGIGERNSGSVGRKLCRHQRYGPPAWLSAADHEGRISNKVQVAPIILDNLGKRTCTFLEDIARREPTQTGGHIGTQDHLQIN